MGFFGKLFKGPEIDMEKSDANAKKSYINSASNLATGRNVCIGAAAALYVYGLIDAIVAPGARRVVITPSADSRSVGVSASVRF